MRTERERFCSRWTVHGDAPRRKRRMGGRLSGMLRCLCCATSMELRGCDRGQSWMSWMLRNHRPDGAVCQACVCGRGDHRVWCCERCMRSKERYGKRHLLRHGWTCCSRDSSADYDDGEAVSQGGPERGSYRLWFSRASRDSRPWNGDLSHG